MGAAGDGGREREAAEVLMLTRYPGQAILIGDQIEVIIHSVEGMKIRVGINAPPEVPIRRPDRRHEGNGLASPPGGSARRRRRVIIDRPASRSAGGAETIGEGMLRDAFKDASAEVLKAVAAGEAVDRRIRRGLMELAREELFERERMVSSDGR
jgi:carbon storage regulator CsrA